MREGCTDPNPAPVSPTHDNMCGILVLCMGYLFYGLEKIKITCHSVATMAECMVLCLGYLFYVLEQKSKSHATQVQLWRSVLSDVWDISLMYGILVLCMGY